MADIPEGCIGPYGDAFDCPVHDPRKQVNFVDPILAAERRGAAQVLREIAKFAPMITDSNETSTCYFCDSLLDTPHDPQCLWLRALALVTPEGERERP